MDQPNGTTPGFRLSVQQQHLLAAGARIPVSQCAALVAGPLDEAALRSAWQLLLERHEILRTTIARRSGLRVPEQIIHAEADPSVTIEREEGTISDDDRALRAALDRESRAASHLEHGPAIRALVLERADDRRILVLSASSAFVDATSLIALLGELSGAYAGAAAPSVESVQYADYAEWRHELLSGDDSAAAQGRGFWSAAIADPPPQPRVLFVTPGHGDDTAPGRAAVAIDADLGAAVARAAESVRVPQDVFLEACWHTLIARLSGADELLVCGYANGRLQADLADAVGAYGQIVPIRTRFEDGTSLAEIVDQVRRARTDATRWQDYASAEDLTALGRASGIGFAYFPPVEQLAPLGTAAVELRALSAPLGGGMWLQCSVQARRGGIDAWLDCDARAISDQDARELAARFATLLQSAAADAHTAVGGLAITERAERAELLAAAAGPATVVPGIAIHERFEQQAQRFPERVAVRSADGRLTFAELDAAANRLANHLRAAGVGRDVAVGLCVERVPEMVIAVLAIHKAGGAYVPLNFEHPAERLGHQLLECKAPVLLTQEHLRDALPGFDGQTICVDRDAELIAQSPLTPLESATEPQDLAYVIYTSGSTGLPKGVAVTHANLANYTAHVLAQLGFDGEHYVDGPQAAVLSSISTDLGNTTIFPTLAAGGCLHLISPEASMDPDAFAAQTRAHPLDILKITPSHLRALLSGTGDGVLPHRWLILGGEALQWELVQQIASLNPSCRIINHYGPTETTIGCCTFELDPHAPRGDAATVPIGRPIANTRAYIVDHAGEPVPPGVSGELCVGGAGVTRGYLGRSEETAERFGPDPFLADPSERVYRTGDRVRRLRDGTIEFLGRVDQQLKIRGYRVEPGEVEAVLARHPAVKQAAVVPIEDARGARLVAYVVAPAKPTAAELTEFLSRSLPEFMLPSALVTIDSLPLSPSGKVDRTALLAISDGDGQREDEFVAPRDQVEQEIAAIWRELLGVERVGVHDDFFALGGHSLLATQAIMRIRRVHGDIPLHALLGAPTVEALADVVRTSASEDALVWQTVEGRSSRVSLVARDRRGT